MKTLNKNSFNNNGFSSVFVLVVGLLLVVVFSLYVYNITYVPDTEVENFSETLEYIGDDESVPSDANNELIDSLDETFEDIERNVEDLDDLDL